MHATPWPYDPLGWAAMLPGLEQRLTGALAGAESPLRLRLQRTRPRRILDLVLDVMPSEARVRNLHTGLEHRLQLDRGVADSPRQRFRALAGVVRALVLLEGSGLHVTTSDDRRSYPGFDHRVPQERAGAVQPRPSPFAAAGRYPRRAQRSRTGPSAVQASTFVPNRLDADESAMSTFASAANRVQTRRF
ncbi:MAG TPA: hypothetical protein VFD32_15995 [Dehalococcoidia bacterium]|nr:hypothetical protein [Dehalococcoidia bacterium]